MFVLLRNVLLLLFVHAHLAIYGQGLGFVDSIVRGYPVDFDSPEGLAKRIGRDFETDEGKARAAFAWIATNVGYDVKASRRVMKIQFSYKTEDELKEKKRKFRQDLALKTLKKRKAICEGYSTLFQELCLLMDIECVIITGTARRYISEIGKQDLPSNHAWNAVKLDGKWKLADVTWAAGSVDYSEMRFYAEYSPAYFDATPEEFAVQHYPDDKDWLMLGEGFTREDFAKLPIFFKGFMGKNLRLDSPKEGIVNVKKGQKISFSVLNLPGETKIAYKFKKDRYGNMLRATKNRDTTDFSISPGSKGTDELVIYFDNEPALGFKVTVK